jgi:hypothetical protein
MDYSDAIDIVATPTAAFAAISDLPSMGRRSPENTGGEWLNASGPVLGARFRGTNARNGSTWSTTARLTTFDPPRSLVFEVTYRGFRVSRWEFVVEQTSDGCRVTEKWRDRRNYFLRRSTESDGFDRSQYTKTSIRATLEALKRELEGSGTQGPK